MLLLNQLSEAAAAAKPDYTVAYAFSAGVASFAIAAERAVRIFRPATPPAAAPNGTNGEKHVTTREFDSRTESVDKRFDLMDERLGRIEDKLDRALKNA